MLGAGFVKSIVRIAALTALCAAAPVMAAPQETLGAWRDYALQGLAPDFDWARNDARPAAEPTVLSVAFAAWLEGEGLIDPPGIFEGARARLARFLNARAAQEIIFTRGTTESINLVAYSFLRPTFLLEARARFARREITPAQLREVEDRAIAEIVRFQQDVGLKAINNRNTWDLYGPHVRLGFANKPIVTMRDTPVDEWDLTEAMSLVHYVFPNVSISGQPNRLTMVSILLPSVCDPLKSRLCRPSGR